MSIDKNKRDVETALDQLSDLVDDSNRLFSEDSLNCMRFVIDEYNHLRKAIEELIDINEELEQKVENLKITLDEITKD